MDASDTLRSFEYQWRHLPTGAYLLSDSAWRENVVRFIHDEVGDVSGKRVLDAGCGNGRWAYGFAKLNCEVHGIDASPSAIKYAREQVPSGHFIIGNFLDPTVVTYLRRYGPFDLIWCWGVLHHTGDPERALANLVPLLHPDGLIHLYLYARKSKVNHLLRWVFNRLSFDARLRLAEALSFATCARVAAFNLVKRRPVPPLKLWTNLSHGIFDAYSPAVADEYDETQVQGWFRKFGLRYERVRPAWVATSTDLFVSGRFSQSHGMTNHTSARW